MENWKSIQTSNGIYAEYYIVSDKGRVISLAREVVTKNGVVKQRVSREMKLTENDDGYMKLNLTVEGSRMNFSIHRLVADAHLPVNTDPTKTELNHIDGDKSNNHASNLEWTSHRDNILHAFRLGLKTQKGEKNSRALVSAEFVLMIKRAYRVEKKGKRAIMAEFDLTHEQFRRFIYKWTSLDEEVKNAIRA